MIVLMIPTLTMGGGPTLLYRQVEWYLANGFEVDVITIYQGQVGLDLQKLGARVHPIYFPFLKKAGSEDINKFVRRTVNDFGSRASKVLFVECVSSTMSLLGEHLAARWKVPCCALVLHPRGAFPGVEGGISWKPFLESSDRRHSLFVMGNEVLASHNREYGLHLAARILPIAVESGDNRYVSNPNRHQILSVGRLEHFKTYNLTMLDAIRELRSEYPDIHYTIVGRGPMHQAIEEAVREKGLDANVALVDFVPYDHLVELVPRFDIHVGMGTTVLDLGRYGLPSLLAIESDPKGRTYGQIYEAPRYCLGEVCDEEVPTTTLAQALRTFFQSTDRAAVSARTFDHVRENHSMAKIMPKFIQDMAAIGPPLEGTSIKMEGELPDPKAVGDWKYRLLYRVYMSFDFTYYLFCKYFSFLLPPFNKIRRWVGMERALF